MSRSRYARRSAAEALTAAATRRRAAPELRNPPLDYTYDGSFEGLLIGDFSGL